MALTGKQRRHLRALGHALAPVAMIGKGGVTDAFVEGDQVRISRRVEFDTNRCKPLICRDSLLGLPLPAHGGGAVYSKLICASGAGFLSFKAASTVACSWWMVEMPLTGGASLIDTVWRWIRRSCASAACGLAE